MGSSSFRRVDSRHSIAKAMEQDHQRRLIGADAIRQLTQGVSELSIVRR